MGKFNWLYLLVCSVVGGSVGWPVGWLVGWSVGWGAFFLKGLDTDQEWGGLGGLIGGICSA